MIRIDPSIDPPRIGTPAPTPRDDFRRLLAPSPPPPVDTTRATGAIAPLAFQEIATARDLLERDRDARHRCETLLVALRKLQLRLLRGAPAAACLAELTGPEDSDPEASDPRLAGLLRAVRLRRLVERAKLEPH